MLLNDIGQSTYPIHLSILEKQRGTQVQSPIKKTVFYPPRMRFCPSTLHFGLMVSPESMMSHHEIISTQKDDLKFVVDLLKKQIVAEFNVEFKDPRSQADTDYVSESEINQYERINKYMFQVPFSALKTISHMKLTDDVFALAFSLDSPPSYFRKKDGAAGHSGDSNTWSQFDSWYRQTDVVYDPFRLQTAKVTLHKETPVIDIGTSMVHFPQKNMEQANYVGRWTTYFFEFRKADNAVSLFNTMKQALQDFNIELVDVKPLQRAPRYLPTVWPLIDGQTPTFSDMRDFASEKQAFTLPFEVRYQLEVCISRNILNEYNITPPFVQKLSEIANTDPVKARDILEYVAGQEHRIYDPMTIFENKEALSFSAKTEIPHYCAYSRKATITPSTIYFSSPTVETTNRVLRHYSRENLDGRFLRVQFTDELAEVPDIL